MKKLSALLVMLLASCFWLPVSAINVLVSLNANPDGVLSTAYPCVLSNRSDCAPPTTGVLKWASTIANLSLTNGATGSRSDRLLYLGGSSAASATLVLACAPTLAGGFTAGADGESWSSTTAYNGICFWTATASGATVRSNDFVISSVAAPGADAQAPPVPRDLVLTNGTGQISVSFDESCDNYESDGDAPGGTSYYKLRYGGSTVTNYSTAGCTPRQLTANAIGSHSPSPTATQSGNGWTIASCCDIDGTDDTVYLRGVAVTGDFTATVQVTSVNNNAASFPKYGIMLRNSTAIDSRFAVCSYQGSTSTPIQLRARASDGASTAGIVTQNSATLPIELRVTYTHASNTFTCETSADGVAYTQLGSTALITGDAPIVGPFVVGGTGIASTGVFANWNLTTRTRQSITYNTVTSGTVELAACDTSNNCSSYITGGTATPSVPSDSTPPTRTVQPSGAANGSSTSINWNLGTCTDASGIQGYIPSTKTTTGGTRTTQPQQSTNTWTQTGLSASTTYFLDSKCVDNAGNVESSFSSEASAATAASASNPSAAPTGVGVAALSTSSLRVTWSAATNAHHYRVRYKKATDSTYTTISTQYTSLTADITGLASAITYDVQVGSANSSESVLIWPSSATQGTTSALTATVKWHPGFYGFMYSKTKLNSQGWINSDVTSLSSHTNVKGIVNRFYWQAMETSRGVYDFSMVDKLLNLCMANNKRLIVLMIDRNFTGSNNDAVPAYLASEAGGEGGFATRTTSGGGVVALQHNVHIMDRFIALTQALAAHQVAASGGFDCAPYCGTTLDAHPFFEGIMTEESTPGTGVSNTNGVTGWQNYSNAAWAAQWIRWMPAARAALPHSNVVMQINYLSGQVDGLMAAVAANGIAVGAPDTLPGNLTTGEKVCCGTTQAGGAGPDYRGSIGMFWQAQDHTSQWASGVGAVRDAMNAIGVTHPIWEMKPATTNSSVTWTADMLPYIDAGHNPTTTACPSVYAACATTP
jgi:hypothetical protein